jgi:dipeptidase E
MRQSGLADLLPSLRRETVYVGTSGGAMVATPDFGGETYDDNDLLTGSDRALGLVDLSLFPAPGTRGKMPDTSLAKIGKWAAGLSVPAYAIGRSDRHRGGRRHRRSRLRGALEVFTPSPEAS